MRRMRIRTMAFLLLLLFSSATLLMAQPENGGGGTGGGTDDPDAAPISGIEVLIGLGALWGARKVYAGNRKKDTQ